MWKKVSFKDYRFRDKVCVSGLMFCVALCGVFAADRYMKNDIKGACAGVAGLGMSTILAVKCSHSSCKRARHRKYYQKERG